MIKEEIAETLKKSVTVIGRVPMITKVQSVTVPVVCFCFLGSNVNWKVQFMTTFLEPIALS